MVQHAFQVIVAPVGEAAGGEPCPVVGARTFQAGRSATRSAAVAVAADGGIVVACRERHVVRRLAADGTPVAAWGGPGTDVGRFRDPRAVAVLADGRVVVADALNARIRVFSGEGEPVAAWAPSRRGVHAAGFAGAVARALFAPAALAALADGSLLVASDLADGAVVLLAGDGSPVDVFDGPGAPRRPAALAATPGGEVVYAASGMGGGIGRFADGRWMPVEVAPDALRGWALLPALSIGVGGALWAAARSRMQGDRDALLRIDPSTGCATRFAMPAGFGVGGVAVGRDGRVVVGGAGGRVAVFVLDAEAEAQLIAA